jgi:endonuclease YncB( thermonuclease family)
VKLKVIVNSVVLSVGLGSIVYSYLTKKTPSTLATTNLPSTTDWQIKEGSIYDGDTLRLVDSKGQELKVRLCGIDAPEIKQEGGVMARDYLRSILKNVEKVHLIEVEKDRYGRTVGEIFIDRPDGEEFHINSEMVMKGMAWHYGQYSGNCPNQEGLIRAEKIAQEDKTGIWQSKNPIPPWEWRKRN